MRVGKLEQEVNISKGVIKQGFRIEGGKLCKFTKSGRKRNHWINHYRHKSRKFLKDKCENRRCSTIHNLTVHHIISLSSAKSEEELINLCEEPNCITLCRDCHNLTHYKAKKNKVRKLQKVKESSERLLVLEQGLWGEYRIIGRI